MQQVVVLQRVFLEECGDGLEALKQQASHLNHRID
jgi:hypothetical protein